MPGAPSLGPVSLWPSSPLPFLRNCPRETRRGQLESQTLALCAKHCAGICPQATASQPDAEPQPRRPRLVPRRPRLPRAPCCGLCDGSPGASRGQAPRLPHSAGPCTEQALQAELERDPGAEALCGPRSFELSEKVPALLFCLAGVGGCGCRASSLPGWLLSGPGTSAPAGHPTTCLHRRTVGLPRGPGCAATSLLWKVYLPARLCRALISPAGVCPTVGAL